VLGSNKERDTYNDVELAELLVDTANEDVDLIDDIGKDTSSNIFVVLSAVHQYWYT
jgi:hypothetical protein